MTSTLSVQSLQIRSGEGSHGCTMYVSSNDVMQHFIHFVLFVWVLQGMPLGQNISSKIVRSNQSLVLQKVNRFAAGEYQCSALNSEGETVSNELALKIKCK
jgi:hypothetical protein